MRKILFGFVLFINEPRSVFLSSITKNWAEKDFRKELKRLDEMMKRSQGIDLVGAELDIEFSRTRCTLGMYYPKEKKFKFSLLFF
jgi:hypothetical protein